MNIRSTLLGGAALAAAAFAFTPALADEPAGAINIGYSYVDVSGGSGNDWNVGGNFVAPISDNWRFQGVAQYDGASGGGLSGHVASASASVYYRPQNGRVGVSVGYADGNISGVGSGHGWSYGVFGEYYGEKVTFTGKIGILDPQAPLDNVTYVGAALTGYANDNWAISGQVNYFDTSGGNMTLGTLQAEYLFPGKPVSLSGFYTYANISGGGGSANIFGIQLKVYFGGGNTLQQDHQTGADTFAVTPGLRYSF